MTRNEQLLFGLDTASRVGLEIGPLVSPVVTKEQGTIRYMDHLGTEALRAKYRDDPAIDVSRIVPIDFVQDGRRLAECVNGEKFGYVIASHVIEHVPDMIGWLEQVAEILDDGGHLCLAVPDKRYSFDCRRPDTTAGALLEAYFEKRKVPAVSNVFDHFTEVVVADTGTMWSGAVAPASLPRQNPAWAGPIAHEFLAMIRRQIAEGTYIDVHCQVFTPASFLGILERLAYLRMLDFAVDGFCETPRDRLEFYVRLRKLDRDLSPEQRVEGQVASVRRALEGQAHG